MALPLPDICELIRAHFILLGSPGWKEEERDRLLKLLAEHGLKWSDLPEVLLATANLGVTTPPDLLLRHHFGWGDMPKVFADASAPQSPKKLQPFRRLAQCFGLFGDENSNVAAGARKELNAFLTRHKLSWAELTAILAAGAIQPPLSSPASTEEPRVNVLGLVLVLLEKHICITEAQRMVVALWALFTWICFQYFSIAPRLAILSPVDTSGKSLLLELLEALTFRPYLSDSITPAALLRQLYVGGEQTIHLDEGDNLGLFKNEVLRSILNSGHRYGHNRTITINNRPVKFSTFGPIAIAAIGTLPAPLLSRCVAAIQMLRPTPEEFQQLEKFSPRSLEIIKTFHATREEIQKWAATCKLSLDPDMPPELILRNWDNCRPLLAVADSLNFDRNGNDLGYSKAARAALVELCGSRQHENIKLKVLRDAQTIFEMKNVDWM
jgi:hypothetical protein